MIRFILIFCAWAIANEADHLLLTRVVTQPTAAESFSIYNPTDSPINLNDYYICDDEDYYEVQIDEDMSPSHFINGFTAKFPNISIDPKETLIIGLNYQYDEFYGENFSADLVMYPDQDNSMIETESGSFGKEFSDMDGDDVGCNGNEITYCNDEDDQNCIEECGDISPIGKLNDSSELLILFYWNGDLNSPVEDVDYFLWGGTSNVIDKTDIPNYQDDTAYAGQLHFMEEAKSYYAYSRIGSEEIGEDELGGNGITGHDETSENLDSTWTIIRSPEFEYGCTDIYAVNYNPLAEQEINTSYELNTGLFEFNSSLSCRYSFKQIINNEFETPFANMKVYGRVVDFFDVRKVSSSGTGPQNITIEDEDGYRITITVWDWEVANSEIAEVLSKYNVNLYYLWAQGELGYYEDGDEWQVDISSSDNIFIANNYTSEGEYSSSATALNISINPEPFVLIPALGHTLDYNFTFPEESRVIIRIFDISGRFITSLIDKYYENDDTCCDPPASFNGRDRLGQILSPGTYIMHMEVMNPKTGDTQTDAAPIVIGVKN